MADKEEIQGIYYKTNIDSSNIEQDLIFTKVTERDRFKAAKQMLFILCMLFTINLIAIVIRPGSADTIVECGKSIFLPIATLIIGFCFRGSNH